LDQIPQKELLSEGLVYAGWLWGKPSFSIYEKLRQESEYAAWLYIFGFRANHFTVSINALKTYDSLQKVNALIKENGYLMNGSGGEIKGSPADLLEQSSIKSEIIDMDFTEGLHQIPACYYEFARRYPDLDGKLYSGFIAKSADKIFESTNFYKK
jgi:2-oxoadipate dioxygenase/decarboxylase-like protein